MRFCRFRDFLRGIHRHFIRWIHLGHHFCQGEENHTEGERARENCLALLVGNPSRVHVLLLQAHVKFSDPITIRFGDKGAGEAGDYDYDDNEPQDQTSDDLKNSNPMERFRKLAKKSHKPSPFP